MLAHTNTLVYITHTQQASLCNIDLSINVNLLINFLKKLDSEEAHLVDMTLEFNLCILCILSVHEVLISFVMRRNQAI